MYLLKQVMSETLPLICPAQMQDDHFGIVVSSIGEAVCKLQKGCSRLAAASNKAYQLLAHGRWFSPGTPASSTTKTGRHDIAEILLKVALNTINQIKSNQIKLEKPCPMMGLSCG